MYSLKKFPLLPRKPKTDKSHYGHALIVAGSQGMTGAAILSSRAALCAGAGLVTLASPKALSGIYAKTLIEVMQLPTSSAPEIIKFIEKRKINSLLIGPGLSQKATVSAMVRKIVASVNVPTVLDADGLNSFKGKNYLLSKHGNLVLTPHKKEFERLFQEAWPKGEKDRISLGMKLAKKFNAVLVLKEHRTVVASAKNFYVNHTGNAAMAKGGSGDVLSGVITAFIAQGLHPFEASCWAVYFHGKSGDIAVKQKGQLAMIATDLIDNLPKAFRKN